VSRASSLCRKLCQSRSLRRGPARGGSTLVGDGPAGDAERPDEASAVRVVSGMQGRFGHQGAEVTVSGPGPQTRPDQTSCSSAR